MSKKDKKKAIILEKDSDETGGAFREITRDRRADKIGPRALRMIEAILTYVEANAIDRPGIWLDPCESSHCEEFMQLYLDEGLDLDLPSFHSKNPSIRITQFPGIIIHYLNMYANPLIPSAAVRFIKVLVMSPSLLTLQSGAVVDPLNLASSKNKSKAEDDFDSDNNDSPGEDSKENNKEPEVDMTTTMLKYRQAVHVISFLTPWEQAVFARLLIHIYALHLRACFNDLAWRNVGVAFSFMMRGLASDKETCSHYASKVLEFFCANIDELFSPRCLEPLDEACEGVTNYSSCSLSQLARSTYMMSKYRLFPGSPAVSVVIKINNRMKNVKKSDNINSEHVSWLENPELVKK